MNARNNDYSVTGLPMRRIGLTLQGVIDAGTATEDDDVNKRDAFLLLDNWSDYHVSAERLVAELVFNFGYDADAARAVYDEWLRVQ